MDCGLQSVVRFHWSKRVMKLYFSLMIKAKFGARGYAMIMFYFLSLNKPEFTQYAKELSLHTTRDDYYFIAWFLTMDNTPSRPEYQKVTTFLRENCKRNDWNLTEWLKIQSKVWNQFIWKLSSECFYCRDFKSFSKVEKPKKY